MTFVTIYRKYIKGKLYFSVHQSDYVLKRLTSFILILIFQYFSGQIATAQNSEYQSQIDSLQNKIDQSTDENKIISWYTQMGSYFISSHPKKALEYFQKGEERINQNTPDSLQYQLLVRIANAYEKTTTQSKSAAQYYDKALRYAEKMADSAAIGTVYFQMGALNFYQGDLKLAEKYFVKSKENYPKNGNMKFQSNIMTALGVIYTNNHEFDLADSVMHIGRNLAILSNDSVKLAVSTSNIGEIKWELGQRDSAMIYVDEALKINQKLNDSLGIAWCAYLYGSFFMDTKEWNQANVWMQRAIEIWEALESLKDLAYSYEKYAKIKQHIGDYKSAYEVIQNYIAVKDSIFKKDNIKHIQELEKKYESEKDSLELANVELQLEQETIAKEKEKLEKDKEIQSKNKQFIFFMVLGILLIGNGIYFFYKFRETKKSKETIEEQKYILEEKNREITDSINYARRIQNAILPSPKSLQSILTDHFIFYQPKDIVAGDFYWAEEHNGITYIAVADCTGHGVPGAMVSVICANALSKVILEEKIKAPAEILNHVRERVIRQFKKSEEEIKDGMDISLGALDYKNNAIQWAGANNPLWIIRNTQLHDIVDLPGTPTEKKEAFTLLEFKGDKQPIGKYENETPFTNHNIQLQTDDRLIFFTDGFSDQFGGEKGKKMKANNFKKLLLSIQEQSMNEQREAIQHSFSQWKGELEQLDDVCILVVKV